MEEKNMSPLHAAIEGTRDIGLAVMDLPGKPMNLLNDELAAPLLAFTHEHLAAYKCPREIIFTDSLPRTANGKVRRRDLARWRR